MQQEDTINLTRRTALKSMVAALASFILPAPRPRLNLLSFCARREHGKYDLRLPYSLEDWTYATDSYLCVRVRPDSADRVQRTGKIPPFDSLSWNHDRIAGWRQLPRLEPLVADESECPACHGWGLEGDAIAHECERCGGTGHEWVGTTYNLSHPITCRTCKALGHIVPPGAVVCRVCQGNAIGRFASVVKLGDRYFAADLYAKVRGLGGEFVLDNLHANPSLPMLKVRADGVDGMLMGMDAAGVERRLVKGGA